MALYMLGCGVSVCSPQLIIVKNDMYKGIMYRQTHIQYTYVCQGCIQDSALGGGGGQIELPKILGGAGSV